MVKNYSIEISGRNINVETGRIAKQANGSVVVTSGETVVLVTAVATDSVREGIDFLPLTVEYLEMSYAGGQIPGNFFRRDMSDINLIVAGNRDGVVMVEGGSRFVSESDMIDAIFYGHEAIQPMLDMQESLKNDVGKAKRIIPDEVSDASIQARVDEVGEPLLKDVLSIADKMDRQQKRREAQNSVLETLLEAQEGEKTGEGKKSEIKEAFHSLEKKMVRGMILNEGKRMDGRAFNEVRPIECLVGLLPRIHGSALFTRGETQAMVLTTLGTERDRQRIESIFGEEMRSFILHYNFPPYSVGEAKRLGGPGRREIGHGALARRALLPVLPKEDEFQYCVRVVSEILESNGSSSMASVCGGCLSMMDAGVPLKDLVAGVAMGLVEEGGKVVVLTDILGDEDHYGDMDFKVTGTTEGITALQMDIKVERLTREVMEQALAQAREGRLHILSCMKETIAKPRDEVSKYAPIITTVKISPEKVRVLIGPGGKTIREISNVSGARIDVDDEGVVTVSSPDKECSDAAMRMIKEMVQEAEVGKLYPGKVVKIMDFGAFVEIFPGTDGLVHISQLAPERVNKVTDILNEGDEVLVKVLEVGKDGRIRLSRKAALGETPDAS